MTIEWATIAGGERVTDLVIALATGQIFKAEIWSVAVTPLLSERYESQGSLTNGKDLDRFHCPDLTVDGPLQSDFALNKLMLKNKFEFSKLSGQKVNVLVFPNLDSANITFKVIKELDGAQSIGPILMGVEKPAHILQLKASVEEIVNMSAIAVVDAQNRKL